LGKTHFMNFVSDQKEKLVYITSNVEKLDAIYAPELKSELVLQNRSTQRNIIVDLSATKYIDSSGLSALLVGQRLCRDANGTFVVCGLQETVKKLISISQLDSVFKITPTLNEAIDLVYMEEVEREI
jgi:anti-sigma B factor antagonist